MSDHDLAMLDIIAQKQKEAKESEIEITPEMIEAGLYALTSRYLDLCAPELDLYPEILCTVYRAMKSRL